MSKTPTAPKQGIYPCGKPGSAAGGICTLVGITFVGLHWVARAMEESERHHGAIQTLFGVVLLAFGLLIMGTRRLILVEEDEACRTYQIGTRFFGLFSWWHGPRFDRIEVARHIPRWSGAGDSTSPLAWSVMLSGGNARTPTEATSFPSESEARTFAASLTESVAV